MKIMSAMYAYMSERQASSVYQQEQSLCEARPYQDKHPHDWTDPPMV